MFDFLKGSISKRYFNRGMKFFEKENYEDAILFFNTAEKYFSSQAMQQLYFDSFPRGIAHYKTQEYKKAEFDFLNYLEFVKNDERPYLWLGKIYERKQEYNNAIRHLEKYIEINPVEIQGWNKIGLIKSHLGLHQEALKDLKHALKLNPEHPDTHTNLATTYLNLQNFEKAEYHIIESLEIDTSNPLAHKNEALLLIENGKYRDALGVLYKAEDADEEGIYTKEIKELIRNIRLELRED